MSITSTLLPRGVRTVTMDYPPVNALPVAGWFDVAAAMREASADPETRVVILRAEGRGFNAGVDMTGLDAERIARSHRQIHLFHYPFYYIEYGLAQFAALQIWQNAQTGWTQAIADYRAAMALGGSRPLPELYARAGARMVFDADAMADLIAFVEAELDALDAA